MLFYIQLVACILNAVAILMSLSAFFEIKELIDGLIKKEEEREIEHFRRETLRRKK